MKYSVLVCEFPDNRGTTFISPSSWVGGLMAKLQADPDCSQVGHWYKEFGDTPITMLRNRALVEAEKGGFDFVLFIDSDNKPDLYLGIDGEAKPFWETSFAFMRNHAGPCVIAAPYCGSPPDEGVHAFRWVSHESNNPNPDFALKTITRHEAVYMRGIQRCAAAATGVMLIDMRAVKLLDHPRFYYEWKDHTETDKASTEDVVFTRNLNYAGVPTYINWDAWAGHIKIKMVGKPVPIHLPSVTRQLRRAAKEMVTEPNPAFDAAVKALGEKMQAVQKTFEESVKALLELKTEGAPKSQEPPVRIGVNSRSELPPTQDTALVTPAGMTVLQAGNQEAAVAWNQGRRQDLSEAAADQAAAATMTAADQCVMQREREVQDAKFIETHEVKTIIESPRTKRFIRRAQDGPLEESDNPNGPYTPVAETHEVKTVDPVAWQRYLDSLDNGEGK